MRNEKGHITISPTPSEELYRFGADGNLRLYSYDRLFFALYGYDGGTTRTYKYSFDLNPNWVNGRLEAVTFNMHNAMFYPNSYLNFNNNGYYTKHYYNGTERIASRLGDQNLQIHTHDPELQDRKDWQDSLIRKNIVEITGYEFLEPGQEQDPDDPKPVFELPVIGLNNLIPNTSSIYYYHPNHLGSTCYVTDGNASVVQGFLYAPFGEITNEHNSSFGSFVLPKYSFNAKELDEETGMYYYEARYYQPPVFISRDPLFEGKPNMSPYTYCRNNPILYIDPDGRWEWNNEGNLVAQRGDNAWTMADFLGTTVKNSLVMLKRCGYTVNDKGILNLKAGDILDKGNLWIETKSVQGAVVNNTEEALLHYLYGKGEPADVGDITTEELLSTEKFKEKHNKITSKIVKPYGDFSIDMTDKIFHVGNTGVDYSVTNNGKTSAVTYTLFTNTDNKASYNTDGFWDANFIFENTLGKIKYINRWTKTIPDGPGSNLEVGGGTPYHYKHRTRTFFFKPVE